MTWSLLLADHPRPAFDDPAKVAVLAILERRGAASETELAIATGRPQADISRIVVDLHKSLLVEVLGDVLSPTTRGKLVIDRMAINYDIVNAVVYDLSLPEAQLQSITSALHYYREKAYDRYLDSLSSLYAWKVLAHRVAGSLERETPDRSAVVHGLRLLLADHLDFWSQSSEEGAGVRFNVWPDSSSRSDDALPASGMLRGLESLLRAQTVLGEPDDPYGVALGHFRSSYSSLARHELLHRCRVTFMSPAEDAPTFKRLAELLELADSQSSAGRGGFEHRFLVSPLEPRASTVRLEDLVFAQSLSDFAQRLSWTEAETRRFLQVLQAHVTRVLETATERDRDLLDSVP